MEDLAVTILADGLQVIPGNQVAFKVEVRNLGTVVDRYFCDVLGLDPAWSTVTPASLELLPDTGRLPGQAGHGVGPTVGTFTVSLHPPRHHSALARTWPVAVNVRSENDARIHRIEETSLAILPFGQIGAQLTPSASRSRLSTTPTLRLENLGNQTELVTYEGTDTAGRLDFEFSPPKHELKPGQVTPVNVRLSPSGSNIIGQAQTSTYSIQVRGSGMGTSPVALSGSHAQLSIIPTQLPWFAAVVIALGMAGLALRAMVGTPDSTPVTSPQPSQQTQTAEPSIAQATDAAAPSAQASIATPSASAPASPSSSPALSPTPTASPTLSPTAPPSPVIADWALAKAQELKNAGHDIGLPVGVTQPTTDGLGQVQRFQTGRVYRSAAGVVAAIRGGINTTWVALGGNPGPVAQLGYPKAEERLDSANHPYQTFDKGVLQCSPGHCAYVIPNKVFSIWRDHQTTLGYPVKHGGSLSGGALGTQFENGIVYVVARTDFHVACTMSGQVITASSPITNCSSYVTLVKAMP
jgi:LGFP repeat